MCPIYLTTEGKKMAFLIVVFLEINLYYGNFKIEIYFQCKTKTSLYIMAFSIITNIGILFKFRGIRCTQSIIKEIFGSERKKNLCA